VSSNVAVVNDIVSAQTQTERTVIQSFDQEFARLHARSCQLIETTPVEVLYDDPREKETGSASPSVAEYVLRSAGVVEQTFGGLTSNLWDNPFEWTLPETLSTRARVLEYLVEVEETRKHAFACFTGDEDLLKKIATPSGEIRPLIDLLLDTLVKSLGFQGRAVAIQSTLSNARPAWFTI
jgi:hypothetical protein